MTANNPMRGVGPRIATARRARNLTQAELASAALVSYSTLIKIERGARYPSDDTLDAIAGALGVDPGRLLAGGGRATGRVHAAMPALSAAIAAYDLPDDGPTRPLDELAAAVDQAVAWRLGAQYVRLAETMPALLGELSRAYHGADAAGRRRAAKLLVSAYRSADAVAYKYGHRDLSARLIELMRWATPAAGDELLPAAVAYVRTEVFFAARAHGPGLRALEAAVDATPRPVDAPTAAARGALHMRAAVIAGRASQADRADEHLTEARALAALAPEGVYAGTAFGPDSVRIHELSFAVSLGDRGVQRALDVAREWAPPRDLPAERRSGFYIELSRAQLWGGLRADAFESLRVARRIAPQHTREHPWTREVTETLLRLSRAERDGLAPFAEWAGIL
jgi:transcriptional regulator with XRE-family HTH domain